MNPFGKIQKAISSAEQAVNLIEKIMDYRTEHVAWSDEAFGPPSIRGPIGPLQHLKKECDEAIAKPTDIKEYADILNLALDAARRAGFTLEQLVTAAHEKVKENKTRKWPALYEQDPNSDVGHVK